MNNHKPRQNYSIELRGFSGLEPGGRPDDFCVHLPFEVKYGSDLVGAGHAFLFRLVMAHSAGFPARDVIASSKEYAEDFHSAAFAANTNRLLSSHPTPNGVGDVLYIDGIKLLPTHRGHGLALKVTDWLFRWFGGGCTGVFVRARPLARYDQSKPDSVENDGFYADAFDAEVYASPFPAKGEAAKQKLQKMFAAGGFRRLATSDFMVSVPPGLW